MADDTGKTEVLSKEEARGEDVREQISDLAHELEENYMKLAKLLDETYEHAYYLKWGYESFKTYCNEELSVKYRRARYLVVIASTVRRLNLEWDRVISIGRTKMRSIAGLLTDANYKEWLDQAEDLTTDQLVQVVKDSKGSSTPVMDTAPKILSMQLRMNEDEAAVILDVIDKVKLILDTDSAVTALEHVAYEFLQQSGESPAKADLTQVLGWVRRSYGVDLVPADGQDISEMLDQEGQDSDDEPGDA